MLGRTLNTQIYIDSEQTIVSDLKDTFSCKNSNQSTNILKINTSTYSVARTANHISQRLNEASKRLQTVERSVSRSRNKANNLVAKNNESIKSQQIMDQSERTLKSQKQLELSNIFIKSERSYIQLINKLKDQILMKNNVIEQLENKLSKKQKLILSQQQKYLKQQNSLIIEINRLKDLLQQISENQNKTFREKVEMERLVDEHKVRLWQLETKLKNSLEIGKGWEKKQKLLKLLTKKYYSEIQKQQVSTKGLGKKGKNNKQFINSFVNVLGLEEELYDEDKENKCQLSNRNKNVEYNQLEEWQGQTYRSFTVQKGKKDNGSSLIRAQRILSQEFIDEGVKSQNEDLYYFLAIQASTIQKLGI